MPTTLKLSKIGNSRGIRLPKKLIERYGIEDEILVEEKEDTLVLKPIRKDHKLSWEDTYKEMAMADENWEEWDVVSVESNEDW